MALSKKQNAWYWREWGAVRKINPKADRHELHMRALGHDKSHSQLTNRELDKVLKEFWAISHPNSLNLQMHAEGQSVVRARYTINQLPPQYVARICADRFGHPDWETLSDADILTLAMTLDNRREVIEDREIRSEESAAESLDSEEGCLEPEPVLAMETSDNPF